MFLISTHYINNQNIVITNCETHCDKKPRGKVGGSVISVYQALLHPPTHREPGDKASAIVVTIPRFPLLQSVKPISLGSMKCSLVVLNR